MKQRLRLLLARSLAPEGDAEPARGGDPQVLSRSWARGLILLLFVWFVFQAGFFAFTIVPGVGPDEAHHYHVSLFYAQSPGLSLQPSDDVLQFGPVHRWPYLYHLLMGKLQALDFLDGYHAIVFMRLWNVLLGALGLWVTLLLVREITDNRVIGVTVLIVLANIPMFVFLAGMASYDNLVNLLAVLSFYLLLRTLRDPSPAGLLALGIVLCTGSLVKLTFLPLIVIHCLLLLWHRKTLRPLWRRPPAGGERLVALVLAAGLAGLVLLNLDLYLSNLLEYRTLYPSSEQVFGLEEALERDLQFRTYYEARQVREGAPRIGLLRYASAYALYSVKTTFGILAHRSMVRRSHELWPQLLLVAIALALLAARGRELARNRGIAVLAAGALAYSAIVFLQSYRSHLDVGLFGISLQGRYNFPVLANWVIVLVYGLMYPWKDRVRLVWSAVILLILVHGGFWYFLANAGPEWFEG